jgi:hypothetical protein
MLRSKKKMSGEALLSSVIPFAGSGLQYAMGSKWFNVYAGVLYC